MTGVLAALLACTPDRPPLVTQTSAGDTAAPAPTAANEAAPAAPDAQAAAPQVPVSEAATKLFPVQTPGAGATRTSTMTVNTAAVNTAAVNTTTTITAVPVSSIVVAQAGVQAGAGVGNGGSVTLGQFLDLVRTHNDRIGFQKLDTEIAHEGVRSAEAIYEPVATLSVARKRILTQNTAEEQASRDGLLNYDKRTMEYEAGVSTRLPTGATVGAEVSLARINSNLQDPDVRGREYKAFYGLSLTQPLTRDAGIAVTESNINIARINAKVAGHATDETTMAVLSQAVSAYLELRLAQERQQIWQDGIRIAEQLRTEVSRLYQQGRVPQGSVLEVENGLSRYRAQASEARQKQVEAMNRARALLVSSSSHNAAPLVAADPLPKVRPLSLSPADSLARAREFRPDYLSRRQVVEREGLRIAYAENQTMPRVDLVASYGLNGLALNGRESLDIKNNRDFPTWTVGVEVSMPLYGNQRAESELRMAQARKRQALIELQAIESVVANDVETSINAVTNAYEQWKMYSEILESQQKLLRTERELLSAGRSDARSVLAREEAVINARTSLVEQVVAFEKARTSLELAQGTLLKQLN